jgi:hypothetical protein
VFHFAKYVESYNQLEIYAPLYDDINFDTIKLNGKYRKIVIDKCHNASYVCNNVETEKYNLDFPVHDILGNIILRNIEKRKINGFVKVDNDMAITKKWMFNDIFFCGEPIAVQLNNKNGLIAFGNMIEEPTPSRVIPGVKGLYKDYLSTNTNAPGGVVLLNMDDGNVIKYSVNDRLTIGFHTVSITL